MAVIASKAAIIKRKDQLTLYVPANKEQLNVVTAGIRDGRFKLFETEGKVTVVLDPEGRTLPVAVKIDGLGIRRAPMHKKGDESIYMVVLLSDGPPHQVVINGKRRTLNSLPFAVLNCVIGRHYIDTFGEWEEWPKGRELAEKCASILRKIDARFSRGSSRDLEAVWAGWMSQARKEVARVFPEIRVSDLLPDGKKFRRDGMRPRISASCFFGGADLDVWLK